ncbi:MAG TPA: hypothetical protein VMV27_07745 [Candidatus Binataceae bacterium]|nr:hypothetical protein [Candidatus Binataceae bacterium]
MQPPHDLAGAPSAARDRIWKAVRMQKRFRIADIAQLTGVPRRKAIEKYLLLLEGAGYLASEGGRGKLGKLYHLVRDTGPFAPRLGRHGAVLDLNTVIAEMRARRKELLAEIIRVEQRLSRLGAYVEKFSPATPATKG